MIGKERVVWRTAEEVIANTFADLLEMPVGQGIDDLTWAEIECVSQAFEKLGRPVAAARLRRHWELHHSSHVAIHS